MLFWLSQIHQQGEIGFIFHPAFQGRGLATEAAGAMLRLGFDGLGCTGSSAGATAATGHPRGDGAQRHAP